MFYYFFLQKYVQNQQLLGLGRAGIFLTDQVGSILKSSLNDISLMVSVR